MDREKIRAMQSQLQTLINHSLSSSMALTGIIPPKQSTSDMTSRGKNNRHGDRDTFGLTREQDWSHGRKYEENDVEELNRQETREMNRKTRLRKPYQTMEFDSEGNKKYQFS